MTKSLLGNKTLERLRITGVFNPNLFIKSSVVFKLLRNEFARIFNLGVIKQPSTTFNNIKFYCDDYVNYDIKINNNKHEF